MVVIFKHTIFSNPFLKTPTFYGRMDGRSCSCMHYSENLFKLEHDWEDRLYDVYTWSLLLFQLVSLNSFIWYQYEYFFCILIYVLKGKIPSIGKIGIKMLICLLINWYQDFCFSIGIVSLLIGINMHFIDTFLNWYHICF